MVSLAAAFSGLFYGVALASGPSGSIFRQSWDRLVHVLMATKLHGLVMWAACALAKKESSEGQRRACVS